MAILYLNGGITSNLTTSTVMTSRLKSKKKTQKGFKIDVEDWFFEKQ